MPCQQTSKLKSVKFLNHALKHFQIAERDLCRAKCILLLLIGFEAYGGFSLFSLAKLSFMNSFHRFNIPFLL
jgi:hypothetical protein